MIHHAFSLVLGAAAMVALNACDKAPPGKSASSDSSSTQVASARDAVGSTPVDFSNSPTVKIAPRMPQPFFISTPVPDYSTIPNLDKPGTLPVLSMELPRGSKLLSAKARVTSSCLTPLTGTLDQVTDGEKDGSDGFQVELDSGKQWLQIDLGENKEIWGLWMWHFHKMGSVVYKGVVVQVSDDPDGKNATTLYNNDYDNSVGLGVGNDSSYVETNNGRFVAGKGTKGRYVRFWSNGRYLDERNHYIEVEIYGK
jgi:hypothetical protein